ncbi:MAG: DUF2288 domain-containing protein [Myxococcales bacterium]|nr:DUF2288 domain-containing protein [Myxococcales bacterium]
MEQSLRTKLEAELAVVGWRDLRQHAARGALFLVQGELSVVEATLAVAQDDSASVQAWLKIGALVRPSSEQLAAWEGELDREFEYLIAQPFVIARLC